MPGTILDAGDTGMKDRKSLLSWSLECTGETQGTNAARTLPGGDVCCGGNENVKGNEVLRQDGWQLATEWREGHGGNVVLWQDLGEVREPCKYLRRDDEGGK